MSTAADRSRDLGQRLWRLVRHDIGRKLTALVFALVLWIILENKVVDDKPVPLDVVIVKTRDEANQKKAAAPGVYLVVPDALLARKVIPENERITLHVRGLKDDVRNLNMSAVVEFNVSMLGVDTEKTFDLDLNRDLFKSAGAPPELTDFRVKPEKLSVTLALKKEIETTLGSMNVTTEGRPKEGFFFKESRILVRPDQVRLSGPSTAIAELRDRPELPRLSPVRLEGRSTSVVQLVGLPQELLDQGVTLETPGNQVEVTIFLEADDINVPLLSVPVHYENEDVLAKRKQVVGSKTPALDVKVTGPPAEIGVLTKEELARRIHLVFDWRESDATLPLARPVVHVYTEDLSDGVKVRLLTDDVEPFIEYRLDELKEGP